jgi:hypothetical protein
MVVIFLGLALSVKAQKPSLKIDSSLQLQLFGQAVQNSNAHPPM